MSFAVVRRKLDSFFCPKVPRTSESVEDNRNTGVQRGQRSKQRSKSCFIEDRPCFSE